MENRKKHIETIVLLFIDLLSIFTIFAVAFLIRKFILPLFFSYELPVIYTMNFNHFLWIAPLWFVSLYHRGLYTKSFSYWDEVIAISRAVVLASAFTFTILFIGKISEEVSRSLLLLAGILAIPIFPLIRLNMQKFLRKYGIFKRRVLIIGSGELAQLTLQALKREPHYGYEVAGFLDDNFNNGKFIDGIKVHNGISNIERYLVRSKISDIFIALPETDKQKIEELINKIHLKVNRILLIPDIKSVPLIGMELHHFFQEQILFLEITSNLIKPHNIFLKRFLDIILSFILLIIFSIPMCLISAAIMLTLRYNPIFTQCRIGKNGKPFKMYKFRTMHKNADIILEDLLQKDEKLRQEWELYWKLKNDPRVTKIGYLLRKTSLDELPQILNILKGEMSLVGPRPYLPEEINGFAQEMPTVWTVLPGITGLWQVSGRSNTDNKYRVALDVWYVRNWSIWLDIVILLKTIKVVIKSEGAY